MKDVLRDADLDLTPLDGLLVSVIGFGNQGHAHALNLRDSGIDVQVGLREGSKTRPEVRGQGLRPVSLQKAAEADVVMVLVPDEVQPELLASVELNPKAVVLFGHGFALHHGLVTLPSPEAAVVAPVGPGHLLRRAYTEGEGNPGLIATAEGSTDTTLRIARAYARALGLGRAGGVLATVAEEVETDLFGEQAVICGGVSALIRCGFEVLVEAGYPAELAYFECAHQMKLLVDLIHERGLAGMRDAISNTA